MTVAAKGRRRRSWLLVPGHLPLAAGSESVGRSDAVVVDHCDLVPRRFIDRARSEFCPLVSSLAKSASVFLRVDARELPAALRLPAVSGLTGIVLAHLDDVQAVRQADGLISRLLAERAIDRDLELVVSLETARANERAFEIVSASPRTTAVTLGRADLVMDLRPEPSGQIHLWEYLSERLVSLANAVGVVPVGALWQAPARGLLADREDTYRAALRGRAIGLSGSFCIADHQVEPLNRAFSTGSPLEVGEPPPSRLAATGKEEKPLGPGVPTSAPRTGEERSLEAMRVEPVRRHGGRVRRSCLFVPAGDERLVASALSQRVDMIILDLEDSVTELERPAARARLAEQISRLVRTGVEIAVRITPDQPNEDLSAAVVPGLGKVMIPKTESAAQVRVVDQLLSSWEHARSIAVGSIEIGVSIESALGVANASEIADASDRVTQMSGGSGIDMARDLEITLSSDVDQFEYPRAKVELAARARLLSGGAGPFLGESIGLLDADVAVRSARLGYEVGVRTAVSLHPRVAVEQMRGFTPTELDLELARSTLARFAELDTSDESWCLLGEQVIDAFAAAQAVEVLEWADMCRLRDQVLDAGHGGGEAKAREPIAPAAET
jgi:citrate lyase subunit beta / citryl-CoA lyase